MAFRSSRLCVLLAGCLLAGAAQAAEGSARSEAEVYEQLASAIAEFAATLAPSRGG